MNLRDGTECVVRPLGKRDETRLHKFFLAVPEEERLFIKQPVFDRDMFKEWCRHADFERNLPLLMLHGQKIMGEATLHQRFGGWKRHIRSEEHTSELQSLRHLVCRLLLEKKKKATIEGLHLAPDAPTGTSHAPAPPPRLVVEGSLTVRAEFQHRAADAGGVFFFFLMIGRPPGSPLFPYTTLFRSQHVLQDWAGRRGRARLPVRPAGLPELLSGARGTRARIRRAGQNTGSHREL